MLFSCVYLNCGKKGSSHIFKSVHIPLILYQYISYIVPLFLFSKFLYSYISEPRNCLTPWNNHLVWYEYTDFGITTNLFTGNSGYQEMCIEYNLARSASSLDGDDLTTGVVFANRKSNMFPLISTIIRLKVFKPCYQVGLQNVVCDLPKFVCVTIMFYMKNKLVYVSNAKSYAEV